MAITNGYTTLQTVKNALLIPLDEYDQDTFIEASIEAVSRMIDEYTGRRFFAVAETRYYGAVDINTVFIDDLLSLTTLKTDADGDGTFEVTWSSTDYRLMPMNALLNGHPFTRIETSGFGNHSFPVNMARAVQVEGLFGYSTTVPKMIAEAAKLQSVRIYKRKDAPFGIMGGAEFERGITIPDLDPDVKNLISPFMRLI